MSINQSLQELNENFSQAHEALVASLQFSGLGITSECTFDEMADILTTYFPSKLNLLTDTTFSLVNVSRSGNRFTAANSSSGITCTITCQRKFALKSSTVLNIVGNNVQKEYSSEIFNVDVSQDNGVTWTNVWAAPYPTKTYQGGAFSKTISLSAYTGKTIMIRFRFYSIGNPGYKTINDITTCQLVV